MKSCLTIKLLVTFLMSLGMTTNSFTVGNLKTNNIRHSIVVEATAKTVEVCGFKDCKRAGGGPRLEKLINTVLEEKGLVDAIKVEGCDCQVSLLLFFVLSSFVCGISQTRLAKPPLV